jgi:hypothetical protein
MLRTRIAIMARCSAWLSGYTFLHSFWILFHPNFWSPLHIHVASFQQKAGHLYPVDEDWSCQVRTPTAVLKNSQWFARPFPSWSGFLVRFRGEAFARRKVYVSREASLFVLASCSLVKRLGKIQPNGLRKWLVDRYSLHSKLQVVLGFSGSGSLAPGCPDARSNSRACSLFPTPLRAPTWGPRRPECHQHREKGRGWRMPRRRQEEEKTLRRGSRKRGGQWNTWSNFEISRYNNCNIRLKDRWNT